MNIIKRLFFWQSFFPAMTKIVGTLGPKSRSVETISNCLKAGMSGMLCHTFSLFIFLFSDCEGIEFLRKYWWRVVCRFFC